MSYTLGLDFGTSFTAAAVRPAGGAARVVTLGNRSSAVPARVFVRDDGSLLHGDEAEMRGAANPERLVTNLKRRLGQRAIVVDRAEQDPVELAAAHLRWAVDRVSETEGGSPDHVVLTHPASWRSPQVDRFRAAVERAGITSFSLVPEPHAAALFHAERTQLAAGQLLGVYDLGGGTFDAAVLRRTNDGFELVGEPAGEDNLGGVDFDAAMLHIVQTSLGSTWTDAERAGHAAFRAAAAEVARECIAAKEALSAEESVTVPVLLPAMSTSVTVTRSELEALIRPSISDTVETFRRALAGADAEPADLTALVLVGGSSQLPLVRSMMADAVPSTVQVLDTDPRHAVARGAASMADHDMTSNVAPSTGVVPLAASAGEVVATAPQSTAEADDRPRRRALWRAVVAAALLVLVGAAAAAVLRDDDAATADDPSDDADVAGATTTPTEPTDEEVDRPAGAATDAASDVGMVPIPAGEYAIGTSSPSDQAIETTSVRVDAFFIDELEIGNEDYLAFMQEVSAPPPASWVDGQMPEGAGNHPVRGVPWEWADVYCRSLLKRLPTDAEWEVAARGPSGTLYPTGDDPGAVDFNQPRVVERGSLPENVSGFGVVDAVGSVWEWVDEPYSAVEAGMIVRRGGEYGRQIGGASMRQVVAVGNQSAISETGFRCAASDANPEGNSEFRHDIEAPRIEPDGPQQTAESGEETFEDDTSGWFTDEESGDHRIGYHGPSWYHIEISRPAKRVMAFGGVRIADAALELDVFVAQREPSEATTDGFRYGVVFRADELVAPSDEHLGGVVSPVVYYAFVVNPELGEWELLHQDSLPFRREAHGALPESVRLTDSQEPDTLGVHMVGSSIQLSINGQVVLEDFDTRGYHTEPGEIGLYLETSETFAQPLVHIHFDRLAFETIG